MRLSRFVLINSLMISRTMKSVFSITSASWYKYSHMCIRKQICSKYLFK
ncbi:hypothetical protein X975_01040, partial [Stegodyphus mimosarum]